MHINAKGGTVRLDPRVKEDRVALYVLRAITGDERLDDVVDPYRGKGGQRGFDSTTFGDDPWHTEELLDFFAKNDRTIPRIIVFEYGEREVPDFESDANPHIPSDDPGNFVPQKVYSVGGWEDAKN